VQDLETVRSDVVSRLDAAMKEVWPPNLPLKRYEMSFAPDAISVRLQYEAQDPLPAPALDILTGSLQTPLAIPSMRLIAENTPAPNAVPDAARRRQAR
jgi:hypothetical protein